MRDSPASLASAVAVLADAAQKYAGNPGRLHAVVDRLAFRIRSDDDLFTFCPRHGPLPLGGGTLWGLICEADSVSAGVLIRRLIVERVGEEFDLSPPHQETLLFSLDEHPQNVAIYEAFSRCPALRTSFSRGERPLQRAAEALETLRGVLLKADPQRIDTDRGCIGRTSGVYGVCDSDAFFVEADLLRAVLELLLSPECHSLAASAAQAPDRTQDGPHAALRRLCTLVLDIGGLLHGHPRAMARATAFLSSALPFAFEPRVSIGSGEELWTLLHMMVTSKGCAFIEDVLNVCATSRMSDAADLRAIRAAILGPGVSKDARQDGRAALCDVRLALCHILLLMFHVMALICRSEGQPPRFIKHVVSLYKARLLLPLQNAMEGPVSSRWPEVRKALGALSAAMEKAPLAATDADWLSGAQAAFRSFAVRHFLAAEGSFNDVTAEEHLDPFGRDVATSAALSAAHTAAPASSHRPASARELDRSPLPSLKAAGAAAPRPPSERSVLAERPRHPTSAASPELGGARGSCGGPTDLLPVGTQPRRFEMRFMKMNEGFSGSALADTTREKPLSRNDAQDSASLGLTTELPSVNLSSLPQPLPLGSATLQSIGRSTLSRSKRPPLANTSGCFYNTTSLEYVA